MCSDDPRSLLIVFKSLSCDYYTCTYKKTNKEGVNSTANPVIFNHVENIGWLCLCTELSLENLMLLSRKSCKAKPGTCKH